MANLIRTQLLLGNEQHQNLSEIAKKEGRSLSEIVREFLDLQLRQHRYNEIKKAADALRQDYEPGGALTEMTALDGEDFSDV